MTTFFISRHSGVIDWAKKQGIGIDKQQTHFDVNETQKNDVVIGTLPVNFIAEVCLRGGRYFHLSLDLPADTRERTCCR